MYSRQDPSTVPFGTHIRTVIVDGKPWFVLEDVLNTLGISKHDDVAYALGELDARNSMLVDVPTDAGPQAMQAVAESGLYAIALHGPGETCEEFATWMSETLAYGTKSLHPILEFVRSKTPVTGKARKEQNHE